MPKFKQKPLCNPIQTNHLLGRIKAWRAKFESKTSTSSVFNDTEYDDLVRVALTRAHEAVAFDGAQEALHAVKSLELFDPVACRNDAAKHDGIAVKWPRWDECRAHAQRLADKPNDA